MSRHLLIRLQLHDRFHGMGPQGPEWPPSPARLFQALVAGSAVGCRLPDDCAQALQWLETLGPPVIGAPWVARGQQVKWFVPNNDADALPNPLERSAIRVGKLVWPHIPVSGELFYAWVLDDAEAMAYFTALARVAQGLYQLGRGPDMAFASADVLTDADFQRLTDAYAGRVFEPSNNGGAVRLAVPIPGSLDSLRQRHAAFLRRLRSESGTGRGEFFQQPPKPRFVLVPYEARWARFVFELSRQSAASSLHPWPLRRAHALIVALRDRAVARLQEFMPERADDIAKALIGRRPDGSNGGRPEHRVRVLPLPSIGHQHADHAIRRVLVEVPPDCPLRPADVRWAFSGLDLGDLEESLVLVPATDARFLHHFGVDGSRRFTTWRTVTPAALPEFARRRRIDPSRTATEAKAGGERADEEAKAAGAVVQALRHAGVRRQAEAVRVQREPFHVKGARAEAFAPGSRFEKQRLWHVEVRFPEPVAGPIVIGDGRFLGLGVMAPVPSVRDIHVFHVTGGLAGEADALVIARSLRRAVMARVQAVLQQKHLPGFFSGHGLTGEPADSSTVPHLGYVFDPTGRRAIIVAPHLMDRREPSSAEGENLETLEQALLDFVELRAGRAGHLTLRRCVPQLETDPLTAASKVWRSVTPYVVTRHRRLGDAGAAFEADLREECVRRGLPRPTSIERLEVTPVPGRGLTGAAVLRFKVAVRGPVLLGRTRFLGGGLFLAAPDDGPR